LARALHPDFGLFWPSPGFLRKLSIAIVFIAIGLIAGTNGILLLLSDDELDARNAFALAHPEPRLPAAMPEMRMPAALPESRRPDTVSRETGIRVIPSPPPPSIIALPPEPKVIRVERKPMKGFEPSRAEAKPTEAKPAAGERAAASPALQDQGTTPSPVSETATVPAAPAIPPETASVPAIPPSAAPPLRASRRASHSAGRNHAEHSRGYSYHPARPSGGFAVLW
jgi:hypothetical protein